MLSETECLRRSVTHLGFADLTFSPSGDLSDCDLALRSACFQAFVKCVGSSDSLITTWDQWQVKVAEYARTHENLPRDLYLVLLADPSNPSITLEDIDRISRNTLFCRKLVCLANQNDYQSVVETLPFLTVPPAKTVGSRALVTVLDGLAQSGYDQDVLDTFTQWISGSQGRLRLLSKSLPDSVPTISKDAYTRAIPQSHEAPHRLET